MTFNLPTILTLGRIVMIPVFVLAFYIWKPPAAPVAGWIFIIAGVTDWLDGYLARVLNQTSRFGAFLDPVADKLLVVVALVLIVQADQQFGPALAIPAAIIIGREITVSALREWMAELGARKRVAVSIVGKVKTIAQMVGVGALLFREMLFPHWMYDFGFWLLLLSAALTLWSMFRYLQAAWPHMSDTA